MLVGLRLANPTCGGLGELGSGSVAVVRVGLGADQGIEALGIEDAIEPGVELFDGG